MPHKGRYVAAGQRWLLWVFDHSQRVELVVDEVVEDFVNAHTTDGNTLVVTVARLLRDGELVDQH